MTVFALELVCLHFSYPQTHIQDRIRHVTGVLISCENDSQLCYLCLPPPLLLLLPWRNINLLTAFTLFISAEIILPISSEDVVSVS